MIVMKSQSLTKTITIALKPPSQVSSCKFSHLFMLETISEKQGRLNRQCVQNKIEKYFTKKFVNCNVLQQLPLTILSLRGQSQVNN